MGRFVAEDAGGAPAEPGDGQALARHWARVSIKRWADAVGLERADGIAFCDTDPVKLHYAWGMAALGLAPRATFDRELALVRTAFVSGRLGLADAVLVSMPDAEVLQARRDADETRRRRNFATHVQLREPLRQWYETLDSLEPGRVIWGLPDEGVPKLPEPRAHRTGGGLLDALVDALPPLR